MSYQIKDTCMYCQRCAAQCPTEAIFYNGVYMQIDENKCISCGACAKICRIDAPYDKNKPVDPIIPHELIEKDCAVAIIGAGAVGMVAAAKLAELTDKKIIVLESNTRVGGGAWYAHTPKIYGSKWQEEHNCGDYFSAHFHKYMDFTRYRLDPHLVYNCFKYTGEFFDWIYAGFSQEIKDRFSIGFYHVDGKDAHPVPFYNDPHPERGDDCFGRRVIERCQEICQEHNVEILTRHRAVDINVKDSRIVAVIAEDPGGYTKVNCEICLFGMGSWIQNKEILKKYAPRFAACHPTRSCHLNPNYRGDGIPLAEKANAFVDYDNFVLRNMGPFYYDKMQVLEDPTVASISLDSRMIYVNQLGKRWIDESVLSRVDPFETGIALEYQPGGVSYTIFDTSILEKTVTDWKSGERNYVSIFGPSKYPETWRKDLQRIANQGTHVKRADSLKELAELCGIAAEQLEATVRRYNQQCEAGFDDDYMKPAEGLLPLVKGPYYAVVCNLQTDGAFGGIRVNEKSQAYAADRKSIVKGLYCGGDFASGRYIVEEGIKRQIINDVSWAYSSAYNAALNIAKDLES